MSHLAFFFFAHLFLIFFFCLYSCFFLSSQSSVSSPFSFIPQLLFIFSSSAFCPCLRSFLSSSSSSSHFLSLCPPPLSPPLPPPVTWFLLILSRQLLSHTSFRSYCSIWWSGRGSRSSSVAQDQRTSPGHVRLISGLSGLVLTGGSRAARGVWVVDARCSVGGARVEGACWSPTEKEVMGLAKCIRLQLRVSDL